MKVSQNDNKIYVKGLDNTEASMYALVKKILDSNPEINMASIEGMVLEVLRRVKEDLMDGELYASVDSVNGKRGVVVLEPSDIGAEPLIEKTDAFNKPFGDIENTICQGNDPRLCDDRNPLPHTHEDYLNNSNMDRYMLDFLKRYGIDISTADGTIYVSKNIVLNNSQITEVSNG